LYPSCLQHIWIWTTQCSETSAHKIQTPGESPKRNNTISRTRRKFEIKNKSLICHNSVTTQNFVIFQEKLLKVLKSAKIFYECNDDTTALQRRVLANCVMTLYLLKEHLQTFLPIRITKKKKCQVLSKWLSCRKLSEMWNRLMLNLVVCKVTTGHSRSEIRPIRTSANFGIRAGGALKMFLHCTLYTFESKLLTALTSVFNHLISTPTNAYT